MVRRRARNATKSTANTAPSTLAVVPANLLEEQYFASPKRKDCKVDDDSSSSIKILDKVAHHNAKATNSHSSRKTTERTIGVPLATRSQTRTIENFFKAKTAKENENQLANHHHQQFHQHQNHETQMNCAAAALNVLKELAVDDYAEATNFKSQFIFEISDEDEEIQTEISDEATSSSVAGNSMENDFMSSVKVETTANIFLQAPVLTLNVDKTPNQASSIKINKTIEVEPVFSSPPTTALGAAAAAALHGRFNQLVTLGGGVGGGGVVEFGSSPKKRLNGLMPLTTQKSAMANGGGGDGACFLHLPENDNSSCDSGVGLLASSIDNNSSKSNSSSNSTSSPYNCKEDDNDIEEEAEEAAAVANAALGIASHANDNLTPNNTRRRKPATPHRILCPSPTKQPPRAIVQHTSGRITSPSAARKKDQTILSPRKSPRHFPIVAAAVVASKSRRRLNPTPPPQQQQQQQQHQQQHQKDKAPYQNETTKTNVQKQQQQQQNHKQQHNGYEHQFVIISDDDETLQQQKEHELKNFQEITAYQQEQQQQHQMKTTKQATSNKINTNANKQGNQNNNNNSIFPTTKTDNNNQQQQQQQKQLNKQQQQQQKLQPLTSANNTGNRELTEFFPVRRSVRKTKTAVKEEMQRTLEQAVLEERAEGLKIAHFEGKGRGVVAARRFQRNEFVVEYIGDLISMTEAMEREKRYALDENAGCYMYYFKHKNQQYCIDATVDTGKLGRLVNHSRNGNLITKVVVVKQRPHLVLLAKDDILPGEELTYDYGDRSKESLIHHPWLAY